MIVLCILLGVACGKVGPPIFPEDIGLAVKVEEQRAEKASGTGKSEPGYPQDEGDPQNTYDRVPQEGDVVWPPLRSLGSQ